jgi:hypothetical protein
VLRRIGVFVEVVILEARDEEVFVRNDIDRAHPKRRELVYPEDSSPIGSSLASPAGRIFAPESRSSRNSCATWRGVRSAGPTLGTMRAGMAEVMGGSEVAYSRTLNQEYRPF